MARRVAGIKIDIAANVASLSADMAKAAGILGGFEKQVNNVSRNLKVAFSGAIFASAAYGVKKLSDNILELAQAGDGAAGISAAFEKLGGDSAALNQAAERAQGLIEKFDLMKVANDGLIKGIPNLNKHLADLADLAARIADAKDLNTTEVFGQLIDAISSGKAQGLKEFGFQIGEVKSKAEGTQVALSQLKTVLETLDPVSLGAGDSITVFKNAMSEAQKNIAIGVDSSVTLASALAGLKTVADPEQMQKFGIALGGLEAVFIGLATKALPVAIKLIEDFAMGLDHIFELTDQGKFTSQLAKQEKNTADLKYQQSIGKIGLDFRSNGAGFLGSGYDLIPKIGINTSANLDQLKTDIEASEQAEKDLIQGRVDALKKNSEEAAKRAEKIAEDYARRQAEWMKKFGMGGSGGGKGKGKEGALTSELSRVNVDVIKTGIEGAIERVDPRAFETLKGELYASTRDAFLAAHTDLVKAKKLTESELGNLADANARDAVATYDERMREALKRHGEELKQMHQVAVQQWQGVFDNLFNPSEFSWKDSLKQLASGFLSEITASLVGGLNANLGTFQGVGGAIGAGIVQYFKSQQGQPGAGPGWNGSHTFPDLSGASNGQNQNVFSNLFEAGIKAGIDYFNSDSQTTADAHAAGIQGPGGADGRFNSGAGAGWQAGSGMTTEQAHAAGIQGPGGADGNFNSGAGATSYAGYVQAGVQVLGDILSAKERDKATKSNQGTGAAAGGTLGAVVGGIFGGPEGAQIGAQIGRVLGGAVGSMFKWGPQNPETKARHAFANFVEEGFKKLERVSFFDAEGKMKMFDAKRLDFVEGSSRRFNPGGDNGANWGDNFNKLDAKTKGFFEGLGQAFEEVLGLTKDVGAQLGYILATNLNGNIDNARLLVAQLNLNLEDMQKALIEAGRTGEMSWAQVEQGMQSLNEAFGEGLVAVGNISGAWDEFIGSGGRGIAALKSLKDLAVETMEAGGRSLADLQSRLLQSGADPEAVASLMTALSQRGIRSLQDLKTANDRTLGGIVADTENGSQKLRDQWKEMSDSVDGLKKTLDGIETNMEKNLTINVKTNFDGNTEQALDKGVFQDTGAGKLSNVKMASVKSAQAQYRRNVPTSSSAKMQSVSINVDARGADRGVHADVVSAMSVMERRIMTKTSDMIYQQVQRGVL